MHSRFFKLKVSIALVRFLTATTSYGGYTNSKNMHSQIQPSKSSVWNLMNMRWGAVQTLLSKANISQIDNNYALAFESESPGRNGLPSTPLLTEKVSLMTNVHLCRVRFFVVWWHFQGRVYGRIKKDDYCTSLSLHKAHYLFVFGGKAWNLGMLVIRETTHDM